MERGLHHDQAHIATGKDAGQRIGARAAFVDRHANETRPGSGKGLNDTNIGW